MGRREDIVIAVGRRLAPLAAALIALAGAARGQPPLPTPKSVRITMEALHAAGGVPPG